MVDVGLLVAAQCDAHVVRELEAAAAEGAAAEGAAAAGAAAAEGAAAAGSAAAGAAPSLRLLVARRATEEGTV